MTRADVIAGLEQEYRRLGAIFEFVPGPVAAQRKLFRAAADLLAGEVTLSREDAADIQNALEGILCFKPPTQERVSRLEDIIVRALERTATS